MNIQTEIPRTHPMRAAWEDYKQTDEYANTRKWARDVAHVDGSLWAAFCEGWKLANERADALHEEVNPASDEERQRGDPGAGAMGAILEYRNKIRRVDI